MERWVALVHAAGCVRAGSESQFQTGPGEAPFRRAWGVFFIRIRCGEGRVVVRGP